MRKQEILKDVFKICHSDQIERIMDWLVTMEPGKPNYKVTVHTMTDKQAAYLIDKILEYRGSLEGDSIKPIQKELNRLLPYYKRKV